MRGFCPTFTAGRWSVCLLVGLLLTTPASAQIDGPHGEVSVLLGHLLPDDHLDMKSAAMWSFRAGLYPSARLGLELVGDVAPSERKSDASLGYDYSFLGARAVVNLSPMELVAPFVFGGVGVTTLGLEYQDLPDDSQPGFAGHLGGGLRAHLRRNLALRAEVRGLFPAYDSFSAVNVNFAVGVSMSFGRDSDRDLDGVTDSIDRCPRTPAGAEVDWRGCPYDDDVDGVPNGIDQCPDTPMPATVDSKGCELPVPTLEQRRRR